jgi:hypothetical protein
MAKGHRQRRTNVLLDELLKDLNWGKSSFQNRFERFYEMYEFPRGHNPFKREPENENSQFELQWEWYPLLLALLRATPDHPFSQKNRQIKNITVEDILTYQKLLVDGVDSLPDYLRYEVQSHRAYQNALKDQGILPDFVEKIAEFITAMQIITGQDRPDLMAEIYKQLDKWIYNAYSNQYHLNLARGIRREAINVALEEMLLDNRSRKTDPIHSIKKEEVYKEQLLEIKELERLLEFLLKGKIDIVEKELDDLLDAEDAGHLMEYLGFFGLELIDKNEKDQDKLQYFRMIQESLWESQMNISEDHIEHLEKLISRISNHPHRSKTIEQQLTTLLNQGEEERHKRQQEERESRRQLLRETIKACQEELKQLDSEPEGEHHVDEIKEQLYMDYLAFCSELRLRVNPPHKVAAQSFVGQLIAPAFQPKSDQ